MSIGIVPRTLISLALAALVLAGCGPGRPTERGRMLPFPPSDRDCAAVDGSWSSRNILTREDLEDFQISFSVRHCVVTDIRISTSLLGFSVDEYTKRPITNGGFNFGMFTQDNRTIYVEATFDSRTTCKGSFWVSRRENPLAGFEVKWECDGWPRPL